MSQMVRPLLRQTATVLNEEEISSVGGGVAVANTDNYCVRNGTWTYEGSKKD